MPSNSSGITLDGEITQGTGAPSNYLIKNCEIGEESKAHRNGIAARGNTTATPTIGVILDNDIYASRRGITTFYIRWSVFKHNTISIVSADADQAFYAGIYLTGSLFP